MMARNDSVASPTGLASDRVVKNREEKPSPGFASGSFEAVVISYSERGTRLREKGREEEERARGTFRV